MVAVSITGRSRRRARDRKTHLAAGAVRDATHRIDRLEGRPRGDEHAPARQQLRLKERDQLGKQFSRLQHAAIAGFTTGLVAVPNPQHGSAVGLELRVGFRNRDQLAE